MFFSAVLLALAALIATVSAQTPTGAYSYTISANDPKASPADKNTWCITQRESCRTICGGTAPQDSCDPSTLSYTCVCSDGSSPDLTKYNGTLPYFECLVYQQNCVAANPTDARAQQSCLAIPCGGLSPTEAAVSSSSSASSSTTSGGSSTSATAAATSAAPTGGAAASLESTASPYVLISGLVVGLIFLGGVAL